MIRELVRTMLDVDGWRRAMPAMAGLVSAYLVVVALMALWCAALEGVF